MPCRAPGLPKPAPSVSAAAGRSTARTAERMRPRRMHKELPDNDSPRCNRPPRGTTARRCWRSGRPGRQSRRHRQHKPCPQSLTSLTRLASWLLRGRSCAERCDNSAAGGRTRSTSTSPAPARSAPGMAAAPASAARATSPTAASVTPTGRMRSVRRRPSRRNPRRLSMARRARPWSCGTYSSPARAGPRPLWPCRRAAQQIAHGGHARPRSCGAWPLPPARPRPPRRALLLHGRHSQRVEQVHYCDQLLS